MSRKYTKVIEIEEKVFEMKKGGKTNREIAEEYGLELEQIRNLIKRHNHRKAKMERGEMPRPKGRPRKDGLRVHQSIEEELKQLRMENELLRDFLHVAGRK